MRCLECHRLAGDRATHCPYCGSAMLSSALNENDKAAEARSIWDDTGPSDKVVYLPRRPSGSDPKLLVADTAIWIACWSLASVALGVANVWGTWIALAVAIACNNAVLHLLESPPWWAALLPKRKRTTDEDEQKPPQAEASNM